MAGELAGKSALITGGGTGIGRATALRFSEAGCRVLVCGRREAPLAETCQADPDKISFVQADVGNDDERSAALTMVMERHGRLDILVNNAAAETTAPFVDHTQEQIERLLRVNLLAPTMLIHEALPHLTESKGCIINVSSAAARYQGMPPANLAPYASTKAGLNQLSRVLATELGPQGIRVNVVSPGLTDTEIAAEAINNPDFLAGLKAITPLGRVGTADDIARVIFFLSTDEARWVTGQVIDASGGFWLSS